MRSDLQRRVIILLFKDARAPLSHLFLTVVGKDLCETAAPWSWHRSPRGRLGVFCTPAGFSALLVAWLGWR